MGNTRSTPTTVDVEKRVTVAARVKKRRLSRQRGYRNLRPLLTTSAYVVDSRNVVY